MRGSIAKARARKIGSPISAMGCWRTATGWVGAAVPPATGTAEPEAAAPLTADVPEGATLGADKGHDAGAFAGAFIDDLKDRKIVPPVASNRTVTKTGKLRKTPVPPEVAASAGHAISQRCRKRIAENFGWGKTTAGLAQIKLRGLAKVQVAFTCAMAACNLIRLPKPLDPTADPVQLERISRK